MRSRGASKKRSAADRRREREIAISTLATVTVEQVYDFERVRAEILHVPPTPLPRFDPPSLTSFTTPLEEATIGIVTTCGAYFPDQDRLGEAEDTSYRLLSRERPSQDLLIAHRTPIRVFPEADPNVAYPIERLLELEEVGTVGGVAAAAVSMVGSITRYEELALEVAPSIVTDLTSIRVDLVLVLPFCPQCHIAAGVLARAIEARGLPTTTIGTLHSHLLALKPPRAMFLDFPLGCPCGRPGRPEQQTRDPSARTPAGSKCVAGMAASAAAANLVREWRPRLGSRRRQFVPPRQRDPRDRRAAHS